MEAKQKMKPTSQWRYTSDERKTELLSRYSQLIPTDAELMGTTLDNLKRQLRRFRQAHPLPSPAPVTTTHNHSFPAISIPRPDDVAQFYDRLNGITHDYVRVMHLCDIHFPYQHNGALDLAVQLVGYTQPHVVIIGSDDHDFDKISSFQSDPRNEENSVLDVIEEMIPYHNDLVNRLYDASPYTIYAYIWGNHNYRIYKYLMANAKYLMKTVSNAYISMIRSNNRVMYLGETDQVKIENLIVSHGSKAGDNPAKKQLEMGGYQINYMSGHVHRRSFYQKRGYHYSVNAVTSGCLCNLSPHYKGVNQDPTNWELGTCLAEIKRGDSKATAHFENLKFDEDEGGGLSVRHHGVTFTAKG